MTTATRGLIRYQGSPDSHSSRSTYGEAWQEQVDAAASSLAASALAGRIPHVAGTMTERQLARFMANQAVKRRRTSAAKLAVIMLGEVLALAAGCYIGLIA